MAGDYNYQKDTSKLESQGWNYFCAQEQHTRPQKIPSNLK